ncbi:FHA domain-containing protein [Saccharopolyspora hattusasensis]|uniref:FHA domain-containing protein n=1 Tax=Saccharopolyspora hattusasensis TaxID=1128679 RepID=UPI003D96A27E
MKYEHLYRPEISDGPALALETEYYRQVFNHVRSHEALGFARPVDAHQGDQHAQLSTELPGGVMQTPASMPSSGPAEGPQEATRPSAEIPESVNIRHPSREPSPCVSAAQLIYTRGPGAGTGVAVEPPCMLGRDRGCDVVLDDPTVSRFHAEVLLIGDRYVLADVGSLNGTYVNGRPVDRAELADGDTVWIGNFHLRFRVSSQHQPFHGGSPRHADRER